MRLRNTLLELSLFTLVAATALAADLVKPDIRPGLWEVTSTPQMSGQLPIPEAQLAQLSAEQRARLEAAMQAQLQNNNKPRTYRECMTPEKIARGFDIDRNSGERSQCKRNVVTSSPRALQMHDECQESDGATSVTDVNFTLKGGTEMSGNIHFVLTSGSRNMTMNAVLQGKWLGASCGSVKDSELVK